MAGRASVPLSAAPAPRPARRLRQVLLVRRRVLRLPARSAGSSTTRERDRRLRARARHHLASSSRCTSSSSRSVQALGGAVPGARRLRELDVRQRADHGDARRAGLPLPVPQRAASTSCATCSWSRWASRSSATSSSRPRRRGSCPSGASPTRVAAVHRRRRRQRRASTRSSTRTPRCPSMHVAFALMIGMPAGAARAGTV